MKDRIEGPFLYEETKALNVCKMVNLLAQMVLVTNFTSYLVSIYSGFL